MRRQINVEELQEFYMLIGEGLWHLLHLEDSLNNYITIKRDVKVRGSVSFEEGEAILAKHRRNTLGKSLEKSRKAQVLSEGLQNQLEKFKEERNWLIHRLFYQHQEDLYEDERRYALMRRLEVFSEEARTLHGCVAIEMGDFVCSQGVRREWIAQEAASKIRKLKGEED